MKDQPFCRTLWSVECVIGRAEFTSVCCGDAHWCRYKIFEIVFFFCRWESRSFFSIVRSACGVLLWLGPWSRMTRNWSVDECVSTDDSPTLTRSVGLRCIFRSSTHVRKDQTDACMRHCCTISQTMPCDDCDVRTATRSSWCGVLFEYVLCFLCMLFVSGASEPITCVENRRSWTLRAIHYVL